MNILELWHSDVMIVVILRPFLLKYVTFASIQSKPIAFSNYVLINIQGWNK